MAIDPVWFAIEQLRRIVESVGWKVAGTAQTEEDVTVTITKKKEEILRP